MQTCSTKSALPDERGADDRKNARRRVCGSHRQLSLQQEFKNLVPLRVSAKHALVQEQMGAVRLAARHGWAGRQEHGQLLGLGEDGLQAANHPLQLERGVTPAGRAGRGCALRRRLAPGTLGWVEYGRGERWNHLLAAVVFFPPVSSAGVVPDGVEDVVASHGLEPPKVQVSSPHPNNRCGIPQNEVDRVAKRIRSLGGAPSLGIDLDYHLPAKVVLAGACEQSPWLLTPRPFRGGTIRMELAAH